MKRYQNFGLLTKKKASKFRCFLFLCERECMRYRVRKPRFAPLHIATAPLFTLHILVIPFVAFRSLYTNLPNAEAIHLFRILGWILNHLSVLDASLCVQARSLSLLYESTSSHQKTASQIAVLFFFVGRVYSARFTPRGALRLNHLFRC